MCKSMQMYVKGPGTYWKSDRKGKYLESTIKVLGKNRESNGKYWECTSKVMGQFNKVLGK